MASTPSFFARYPRNQKALILAMQESHLQGVATRKMKRATERLCGTTFTESLVCRLSEDLDAEIEAWRSRPLTSSYPYVIIDALDGYVREDGRVVCRPALIAEGISQSGHREMLAIELAHAEGDALWKGVFHGLKERGLGGALLVISGKHKGLPSAVQDQFNGSVQWQYCQTCFQREIRRLLPGSEQARLAKGLRKVFAAQSLGSAESLIFELITCYGHHYPRLADKLTRCGEYALTCFGFPAAHRRKVGTTNGLNRFKREVGRRTNIVRVFPNDRAFLRLVGALAMEQSEDWLTGKRYLNMSPLYEIFPAYESQASEPHSSAGFDQRDT